MQVDLKKVRVMTDKVGADLDVTEKALNEVSRQVAAQIAAGRNLRVLLKKLAASGDPRLAQKADLMLRDYRKLGELVQKAAARAGKTGSGGGGGGAGKAPFQDLAATK